MTERRSLESMTLGDRNESGALLTRPRGAGCEIPSLNPKCSCPDWSGRTMQRCSNTLWNAANFVWSEPNIDFFRFSVVDSKSAALSAEMITTMSARFWGLPTLHCLGFPSAVGFVGSPSDGELMCRPLTNVVENP